MHIYVSLALFACFWKVLEARFYAYLRESSPLWHVSGKSWNEYVMHIYMSLAVFACLWTVLDSRFMHIYVSLAPFACF